MTLPSLSEVLPALLIVPLTLLPIINPLSGAPVFMASSPFSLNYEAERWPDIIFTDVKDYQKKAA